MDPGPAVLPLRAGGLGLKVPVDTEKEPVALRQTSAGPERNQQEDLESFGETAGDR